MRNLVTYRPYALFNEMERAFGRLTHDRTPFTGPSMDIREEEEQYVLEAELAGLTEKDVEVKVENDILTLSRKVEEEKEDEKDGYVVRERRHASFRRSFYLPKDVDRDKIAAHFENGLLTLQLPKAEKAKPRQIEVKKA